MATSLAYHAIFGWIPPWLEAKAVDRVVVPINPTDVEIEEVRVLVSRGIYKNALSVGIPRSGQRKGIAIAAAMGIYCYPATKMQEGILFADLSQEDLHKAESILGRVTIGLVDGWETSEEFDILALVTVGFKNDPSRRMVGKAQIQESHTNVTYIGVTENEPPNSLEKGNGDDRYLASKSIAQLIQEVRSIPEDVASKMIAMLELNLTIAEAGREGALGLSIGATLSSLVRSGFLGDDPITLAQIMVASAADSRMGGFDYDVMSSAGSGNQGLITSLPLAAVAIRRMDYDLHDLIGKWQSITLDPEERERLNHLLTALALANLITSYVTQHTSYLSAMCGCAVKAGVGAAAGVAYLLDSRVETIERAIQNMAANITGMLCDGAKEGCALKLSTAASVSILSALLATKGICIPSDNGIVGETVEDTIHNIGSICKAMIGTDSEVVRIMDSKSTRSTAVI